MDYTRRFPLTEDFMNYRVDDLLYGYLQYKATYNPNKDRLYITLDNLRKNKSNIETLCGSSRRTIDRQIKSLIEAGMVEEIIEDNKYIYSLPCVGNRY
jgi:DNA-binding transcriptional ArsR family regulator